MAPRISFFELGRCLAAALVALASEASASSIEWSGPTAVLDGSGETQVHDLGTTLVAENYWGANATLGGVDFTGVLAATQTTIAAGAADCCAGFYLGANAAMAPLLDPGFTDDNSGAPGYSMLISGLTIGRTYTIQLFGGDEGGCCASPIEVGNGLGDFSFKWGFPLLQDRASFILGSFVADAPSQSFSVRRDAAQAASGGAVLTGINVRERAILSEVSRSSDIPIELTVPTEVFALASDAVGSSADLQESNLGDLGTLPNGLDVSALHYASNGDALFAVDAPVSLGGILFLPGDVVRYEAPTGLYSREFDATGEAIDPAAIDAVSTVADDLLLSFDTPVVLEGVAVEPGDLVQWFPGVASLLFDASAQGVSAALNLDGAHHLSNGNLLLSFDASGSLGGVDFDDEDVLEFDPVGPTYELAVDGSGDDPAWSLSNVVAVHAVLAVDDNCLDALNPSQRDTDGDLAGDACDSDDDGDGLSDSDEISTHLTDPLDADSDDDGLNDGDEVLVYLTDPLDTDTDDDGLNDPEELSLTTNPLDPDSDGDGFCDGPSGAGCTPGDNCPLVTSANQTNSDSLPAGDLCQCGDVTNDGVVDATDLQLAREWLVGAQLSPPGTFVVTRCNLIGASDGGVADCDVGDIFVLDRHLSGEQTLVDHRCAAWLGP